MLVQLANLIFKIKKVKFKIAYFMSFAGNENFIEELSRTFGNDQILVVYESKLKKEVMRLQQNGTIIHAIEFKKYNVASFVKGIQLARIALFDNYYPELSAISKTKSKIFFQIWHANGAIKAFGWEDPSTYHRSKDDQIRFQKVYDSFDQIVVGSEKMAEVFEKSWRVGSEKIDQIGYPRTDKYFNENWIKTSRQQVFNELPELKNKRVILYAPTYRKDVSFNLPKDWTTIEIPNNAVLIVRLHPHLTDLEQQIAAVSPDGVIIIPHTISTQKLLCVTDTLITDYSSIAFDFSLLSNAKSVLFFTYDLKEFDESVGIQQGFKQTFANEFIYQIPQLNDAIAHGNSDKNVIRKLNSSWNSLNDGHASQRLIHQIKGLLDE